MPQVARTKIHHRIWSSMAKPRSTFRTITKLCNGEEWIRIAVFLFWGQRLRAVCYWNSESGAMEPVLELCCCFFPSSLRMNNCCTYRVPKYIMNKHCRI